MHDYLVQIVFYFFAALTVLSAVIVITQNNPVRSVLFLVVAFFTSAVIWIMTGAEFLALILVLVYVGAVMTLFLFVIMMLNIDVESKKIKVWRYLFFGLPIVALLVGLLMVSLPKDLFKVSVDIPVAVQQVVHNTFIPDAMGHIKPVSNTEALGQVLYTDYVFAFELAAIVLLVAIIAAITLAHRGPIRSKRQDVVQQIMTSKKERIRLVRMKSEH